MNAYFFLVQKRSATAYIFSTYLFTSYTDHGIETTRRYVKKVNIFSYRYLVIPLNWPKAHHWSVAIVDNELRTIEHWNSLLGVGGNPFPQIKEYLKQIWTEQNQVIFE